MPETATGTANITEARLRAFRIERYEEMKFTSKEAAALADSKGDDGFPLDYRKVRKVVDGGCHHKMALRIFAD